MLRRLILAWVATGLLMSFGLLLFQGSTLFLVVAGVACLALVFGAVCLLFARLPSPRKVEQQHDAS
jgi:hypothetical protein